MLLEAAAVTVGGRLRGRAGAGGGQDGAWHQHRAAQAGTGKAAAAGSRPRCAPPCAAVLPPCPGSIRRCRLLLHQPTCATQPPAALTPTPTCTDTQPTHLRDARAHAPHRLHRAVVGRQQLPPRARLRQHLRWRAVAGWADGGARSWPLRPASASTCGVCDERCGFRWAAAGRMVTLSCSCPTGSAHHHTPTWRYVCPPQAEPQHPLQGRPLCRAAAAPAHLAVPLLSQLR